MSTPGTHHLERKNLVLAAMIFAVAMTFIDQTIVSIAVPEIQKGLHLSATGVQWVVNAYLLSLAALFAFGGRLSDIVGHRRMVVLGVIVFAGASALCGATPSGSGAEAWIVCFRVLQGAGGAIMYPAALAIVVNAFPVQERGRALAVFFAVAGGLTAVGPILGGYLSEWTWRAIFWVNIPVAIVALVLTAMAKPHTETTKARIDTTGLILITSGIALSVLGFQQSAVWGWGSAWTWVCIVGGLGLLGAFVLVERGVPEPLIRIQIFASRAFAVENGVLFLSMMAFIPLFFFMSEYAQISLGYGSSETGLFLLMFFAGFMVAAQIGGRILDVQGAKRAVVMGCALAAVGFAFWASAVTGRTFNTQWYWIVVAGAGMGMMLGPSNTDAINQAPRLSYGEATGVTQTVRNYGASLGLAVLGTVLLLTERSQLTDAIERIGLSDGRASALATSVSQSHATSTAGVTCSTYHGSLGAGVCRAVQSSFAVATQDVLIGMAVVMGLAAVVAAIGLRPGLQYSADAATADAAAEGTAATGGTTDVAGSGTPA